MRRISFLLVMSVILTWAAPSGAQWTHMWTVQDNIVTLVDPSNPPHSTQLVADYDLDGRLEVITARPNRLVVLDAETNTEVFSYDFPYGQLFSQVTTVNIDADPLDEILVSTQDNSGVRYSAMFDGSPGVPPGSPMWIGEDRPTVHLNGGGGSYAILWSVSDPAIATGWQTMRATSPVSCDIDGDGRIELVARNTQGNRLRILDGLTGYPEFESETFPGGGEALGEVIVVPRGASQGAFVFFVGGGLWNLLGYSGQVGVPELAPRVALLNEPRPNPSSGEVALELSVSAAADVEVRVFSVDGRRVRAIQLGKLEAGPQFARWDGRAEDGSRVAAGTYFMEVTADGSSIGTRKAVVVR